MLLREEGKKEENDLPFKIVGDKFMLAKKFRLPIGKWIKDKKIKKITKKSKFFILKTCPNTLGFSRFGVVVGSAVSKSAVRRNYIKRIIFDFIRIEKLYENTGNDYLIIVLSLVDKLTKEGIKEELKFFLKQNE